MAAGDNWELDTSGESPRWVRKETKPKSKPNVDKTDDARAARKSASSKKSSTGGPARHSRPKPVAKSASRPAAAKASRPAAKASSGGPARHKAQASSTGGRSRYKSTPAASSTPKKRDKDNTTPTGSPTSLSARSRAAADKRRKPSATAAAVDKAGRSAAEGKSGSEKVKAAGRAATKMLRESQARKRVRDRRMNRSPA